MRLLSHWWHGEGSFSGRVGTEARLLCLRERVWGEDLEAASTDFSFQRYSDKRRKERGYYFEEEPREASSKILFFSKLGEWNWVLSWCRLKDETYRKVASMVPWLSEYSILLWEPETAVLCLSLQPLGRVWGRHERLWHSLINHSTIYWVTSVHHAFF